MNFLDAISDQVAANDRPLVAVTVAAVPFPDTPIILTLHWHGFVETKIIDIEEAQTVHFNPIPSSAMQLNQRWDDLALLDRAAMEAGWSLGAWDVARAERVACARPGASSRESLECLQAFGALPFGVDGQPTVVANAPDTDELLQVAARQGYLMWLFRPVFGGIWADVSDDATLRPDGTREPPCPLEPVPPAIGCPRRTVYRFGVAGSGVIN